MRLRAKNTYIVAALSAVLGSVPAKADVVADWAAYCQLLWDGTDTTQDNMPADSQVAAAMFEAANAIDRRYHTLLGMDRAAPGASEEAAVITAAHDVLVANFPAKKARIDENAVFAIESLAASKASIEAGKLVGAEAAKRALTRGTFDPSVTLRDYRPITRPGVWIGAQLPVFQPYTQAMRPWVLKSVSAIRPGPPPALDSERYARDFNEVKALGGRNSKERTARQSLMARYRITPDLMPTLRRITDTPGRRLVDNARFMAVIAIADYDEGLAMVDAKMFYNAWRPITAIRNADDDGNPATAAEPGWVPFINTPNHPEYPCGHCGYAAAMAEVLKAEVGNSPPGGVEVASDSIKDAVTMRMASFDDWVREVSFSRTLGGVHFRFSNEAGEELGRNAARAALTLMQPLPATRTQLKRSRR